MRTLKTLGCLTLLFLGTLTVNAQSELKTTAETLSGPVNINTPRGDMALKVDGAEALWYNGTYFSWGYGGEHNYFRDRVGIGKLNEAGKYKLEVRGGIRTDEVVVESTWADFVFEESYKLPTLKEVENYILKHGHLSEIPSAKEVQENGVRIAQTMTKLLQKIEELTLYTIKQQKQIDLLKQQLSK